MKAAVHQCIELENNLEKEKQWATGNREKLFNKQINYKQI
jgi:hypothetical protein